MCTYENPSPLTNFRHLDTGHLHGYISSYSTVHLPKWMMHRLSAACFAQRFCCTTVMASRCRLPRGVAMKLRCGELGKLHCCAFQIQTLSWQNQNTWCRLVIFCLGGLSSACWADLSTAQSLGVLGASNKVTSPNFNLLSQHMSENRILKKPKSTS